MASPRIIHVVSCHAEGEVGDVIVGGVAPPPGETLWQQSRHIAEDGGLRAFMLNEPRGGVFRHVNLLVPPKSPEAVMGFIVMEPEDTPPMSGSNSICVATVLMDTGIVPMTEPETRFVLEAPGGLVAISAACRNGKAERITVKNLPSFACRLDATIEVEGLGTMTVDTAFGGDSFVVVDAAAHGFGLTADEARDLAAFGARVTDAANAQLGFSHPEIDDWKHISFCLMSGPITSIEGGFSGRQAAVIKPAKIDRSPCGTATCARMALMHARGRMNVGDRFAAESLIGSRFEGRIAGLAHVGDVAAIRPTISGRAWVTGTHQHTLDPTDPWPDGYRLSDTWPAGEI